MTVPDGSEAGAEFQRETRRHMAGVPEHDVFVSYSTADKPVADAIVSRLEQAGIRCWIAPRDVIPGMVWAEALIEAIDTSRLMVVVLSGAANQSNQVIREVERAVAHDVVVIPFRIESILPTGAMAYYLSSEHWLDALTPPLESHIASLVKASLALLERPVSTAQPIASTSPAVPARQGGFGRAITGPAGLAAVGIGALALVGVAAFMFLGGGTPQPSATATPSGATSGLESAAPSVAIELNLELAATSDTVELTAGFTPDPYSAEGQSGGEIDVSYLGAGCTGFASEAPDFDVTYTAGGADLLRFYFVAASSDTSMVVNAPDGSWYCSDDAGDSIDPMIDFASPASGLYDIWIGNLDSGTFDDGTLYVTGEVSQHP